VDTYHLFYIVVVLALIAVIDWGIGLLRSGFWPARKSAGPRMTTRAALTVDTEGECCPDCGDSFTSHLLMLDDNRSRPVVGFAGGFLLCVALVLLLFFVDDLLAWLVLSGVILLPILGIKIIRCAVQPAREGNLPHCGKCNYLLIGIESERCPECGTPLTASNVLLGEPIRRPGLVAIGVFLVLVGPGLYCIADTPEFTSYFHISRTAGGSTITATGTDISNLKVALDAFEIDNNRYPTTTEGVNALVTCPPGLLATWTHAYIDKVPIDPWGHAYVYVCPGTAGKDYDLISCGPDGKFGTADDISN
jgi:general secretion pathway protein G